MTKAAEDFDIESHVIESSVGYRGGIIKVNVSSVFPHVENPVMGAYQNYLGGGLTGSIEGDAMFDPSKLTVEEKETFTALSERIKRYFHSLNNGGGDWEDLAEMGISDSSYEALQRMPKSGY